MPSLQVDCARAELVTVSFARWNPPVKSDSLTVVGSPVAQRFAEAHDALDFIKPEGQVCRNCAAVVDVRGAGDLDEAGVDRDACGGIDESAADFSPAYSESTYRNG
jgi:hypothetical protein